jgi:hypothetical protein
VRVSTRYHRRMRVLVLLALLSACEPVKLPHEMPGPPGAGLRDPRASGPTTMSYAQNKMYRESGSPDELRDNDRGGKDWIYTRSSGSVFGEQQKVEIYSFDAQGLLVGSRTDLIRSVGK